MKKLVRNKNILSVGDFAKRMLLYGFYALVLLVFSLGIGVIGYHYLADLGWIDSLLNASMILTGMGPVDRLETDTAKIFASIYSIFSGVIFLTTVAVFLSPLVHRLLHLLHVENEEESES
jgi:hypothetical protein